VTTSMCYCSSSAVVWSWRVWREAKLEVTLESAADHVRFAEQRLRDLVAGRLASTHGAKWEDLLESNLRRSLQAIRVDERQARPHVMSEPHLLGYAGLSHLTKICVEHWKCCIEQSRLWPSIEVMTYELRRLNSVRNPAAHGRTLF